SAPASENFHLRTSALHLVAKCDQPLLHGGESGPGARPMDRKWVIAIRDQCANAGVPFFFKQWGDYVRRSAVESWTARPTTHFHCSPGDNWRPATACAW